MEASWGLTEVLPGTSGRDVTPLAVLAQSADRLPVAVLSRQENTAPSQGNPRLDDFFVQLASLTSEAGAFFEWNRLKRNLPQLLADRDPTVTHADVRGRAYWRLRTFGFASLGEAKQMCRELEDANLHCWTGKGI
jgi:hypothetical protein